MSAQDHKPEAPPEGGTTGRGKPGPKPGSEAAKRGGTAARDKYGSDFYREIGSVGGTKVRNQMGPNFYRDIGRRGGQTTRSRLGLEHYARIGRIGGQRGSQGRKSRASGEATRREDPSVRAGSDGARARAFLSGRARSGRATATQYCS